MLRRFALPIAAAFIVLIIVYFAFLRAAAHDRVDEGGAVTPSPGAAAEPPPAGAPASATAPTAPGAKRVDKAAAERLRRDIQAARERRRVAAAPRAGSSASRASIEPAAAAPPLDKDYVRAQVGEILPLVAECYTHALERDPKLAGELVVRFDIVGEPEVGGAVDGSEILAERSTLTDPELLECVRETMYAIELTAPPAGGTHTITYPFAFRPGSDEEPR